MDEPLVPVSRIRVAAPTLSIARIEAWGLLEKNGRLLLKTAYAGRRSYLARATLARRACDDAVIDEKADH